MADDSPGLADQIEGRTLGALGATGIGVGAIVGGGILALAGTAFATTGPSAVLAFGLNGIIALLTALTFAELATSFPQSGGTYTFAKKVLSVEAAFMVGWVVWFASIVAAVLYALGFGAFAEIVLAQLWQASGAVPPEWLRGHSLELTLALAATVFYAGSLARKSGGGGQWETVGKVVVFLILIAGGFWAMMGVDVEERMQPFFSSGGLGLIQAMGYTFIALQGFDLIAAVGGEVKQPRRNLPRAMIGSLVIALAIYLPLLVITATVGVPEGSTITAEAQADPEAVMVAAVEQFLGTPGLWLVLVGALLSMLSALQANLMAASHIALAMARDRNLPGRLRQLDTKRRTPVAAVATTAAMVLLILVVIPDVAAAGAVSSLIFLLSFALAHWTSILARRRGGGRSEALRLPFFPLVPVLGGTACLALAVFQGVVVPAAGALGALWLVIGAALYVLVFSRRARVADAAAEALDPQLSRLRGRSPLVLVPIANPASAEALVTLANALAPPEIGKVLLLSVVQRPDNWQPGETPEQLRYAQQVLGEALTASFAAQLSPEALTTVSRRPWREIHRVAQAHGCESLLLGLGSFEDGSFDDESLKDDSLKDDSLRDESLGGDLEWLLGQVDSNVVLSRIPPAWQLPTVREILVPVGGRRDQSGLRARLLGSLTRSFDVEVVYLGIVRPSDDVAARDRLQRAMEDLAADESPGCSRIEVVCHENVGDALVERAAAADLVILGLQRLSKREKAFGEIPVRVARETDTAILMISRRG